MVRVENTYRDETKEFETYTEAMKWIGSQAQELNYGLYRVWQVDGYRYWDCGPRTYKMAINDIPEDKRELG